MAAEWTTWTNAFTYWENGPSDAFAASELSFAWSVPAVGQAAGLAFALASLAMTLYAGGGGGAVASVSATVFAGISILLEIKAVASPAAKAESSLAAMDAIIGGVDVACFVWDASTIAAGN